MTTKKILGIAAAALLAAAGAQTAQAACSGCHGYPPMSTMAGFGTATGQYRSAMPENYPGGGGAHDDPDHVSPLVVETDGWGPCLKCHPSTSHALTTGFSRANVQVMIDPLYNTKIGTAVYYMGTSFITTSGMSTFTSVGSCYNVSCHGGYAGSWNLTKINVNSQCTACHTRENVASRAAATQYQSAISGLHGVFAGAVTGKDHWYVSSTFGCGSGNPAIACHLGQPQNHFGANLDDSALVEMSNANANMRAGINIAAGPNHSASADTCAVDCHKDGGRWATLNDKAKVTAAKTDPVVCGTCHGTWVTGWVAGAGMLARPDLTAVGGPGALTAPHDADWNGDALAGQVSLYHEGCKSCHGMNSATDYASGYTMTSGSLWDPNGVRSLHGNGKLEMSGPSADINAANNAVPGGAGYNGDDDALPEASDYSCTLSCHAGNAGKNMGASPWVVAYKNFGQACVSTEICNDGIDNNCDGYTDCADPQCSGLPIGTGFYMGTNSPYCPTPCTDADHDGYYIGSSYQCYPRDCDDNNAAVRPGVPEICNDGIDNNCNNLTDCAETACLTSFAACRPACTDADGDGYFIGTGCGPRDCNDSNLAVNPGAAEVCSDGIDNNCNGKADCADTACSALATSFIGTYAACPLPNTIQITTSTWSKSLKKVNVQATSSYGVSAALRISSFSGGGGAMTYIGTNKWSYVKTSVPTKPASVTVTGPEGSASKAVTQIK